MLFVARSKSSFILGLIVVATAFLVGDLQGLEVLAVQQVCADSEPHGPDVLGPPRHYPGQRGDVMSMYTRVFVEYKQDDRALPSDVPGLDAAGVLPERRHRRGGLEHRRLLGDDDRRADLELRL